MKRYNWAMGAIVATAFLGACKKDDNHKAPGNPVISLQTEWDKAYFGDSLSFTVSASDAEVPLSTLKAQLYYSDEQVSETVIRTKTNGDYTGKIYIPYYANIPNGTATLKLILQNIHLTKTAQEIALPLERPDYPYLTLVSGEQEYRMERKDLYEYAATHDFPLTIKGYIQAPPFGQNGNPLTFGWEDNAVKEGSISDIPFSNNFSGNYSISFNSFDYAASPFIIAYAINQQVMDRIDDKTFVANVSMTQGQEVTIEGFPDLDNWWIDPDFFQKGDDGRLSFTPITGHYRITADFNHQYFMVEALNGTALATLQADGTGAIWIIGEGIGKPDATSNAVGWNPPKALCMAPIGNKKYQATVIAGTSISVDNINFKFFQQKDWGGEFNNSSLSSNSDLIFIGDGSNGRDPGNLGITTGKTLEAGATYVFVVDVSAGNDKAVLSVNKL